MRHLWPLLQSNRDINLTGMILCASLADPDAICDTCGFIEEENCVIHPFEVGRAYLFETVTLYYVGIVTQVDPCWVHLEKASWVHRTGRKSTLFRLKDFAAQFPPGEFQPRTEYVGKAYVAAGAIVAVLPFLGDVPEKSIQ